MYATLDEIREEAGFENNSDIDDDLVQKRLTRAEALINSAIYQNYSLPLSETPAIIKEVCLQLAAGLLLKKEYGLESDGTSKDGRAMIKEGMETLQMIKTKQLKLLDSTGKLMAESTRDDAVMIDYDADEYETGELFNQAYENFKMTDPDKARSSSLRDSSGDLTSDEDTEEL